MQLLVYLLMREKGRKELLFAAGKVFPSIVNFSHQQKK
jgi:hypothetical protein